nr:hypothetical protein [Candidatus Sigynarchaeota archaeon]
WLRDPARNDRVLLILASMRSDPSEYVRKSVGNNLKDLTKYMPGKILSLAESWISETGLQVTPDLASKNKKDLGDAIFYLVWTLKQAMRWIKARNPEHHSRLEKILGTNYVKFFEEKKNRSASPYRDPDEHGESDEDD